MSAIDRDTCEQCGGAIVLDARECVNGHSLCQNPLRGFDRPCECVACLAYFHAEEADQRAIHGLVTTAEEVTELLSRILGSRAREAASRLRAALDECRVRGIGHAP